LTIVTRFRFYSWTTQVIQNVSLTTIAGVFGSYYFTMSDAKIRHATLSSFRRSMTYSFGSIAEGSLIVALLDLLRAALSLIQQQESQSGDMVGAAIACCASCCVACVRSLVDYFSEFAHVVFPLQQPE
jgi:hypothetical protein